MLTLVTNRQFLRTLRQSKVEREPYVVGTTYKCQYRMSMSGKFFIQFIKIKGVLRDIFLENYFLLYFRLPLRLVWQMETWGEMCFPSPLNIFLPKLKESNFPSTFYFQLIHIFLLSYIVFHSTKQMKAQFPLDFPMKNTIYGKCFHSNHTIIMQWTKKKQILVFPAKQ